jgi:hypothetical protein
MQQPQFKLVLSAVPARPLLNTGEHLQPRCGLGVDSEHQESSQGRKADYLTDICERNRKIE